MPKSIILIIVGVILLSIAYQGASSIPLAANRDLSVLHKQLNNGETWVTSIDRDYGYIYIRAHGHRRLLQNFYLGASGLICLAAGVLTLPNTKTSGIPVESE
jgi:hypothetical protein